MQGRAAIDSFVAGMDGDRARRTKWNGLAAELDAELKIVKVRLNSSALEYSPVGFKLWDTEGTCIRLLPAFCLSSKSSNR